MSLSANIALEQQNVSTLKGVGPSLAEKLAKLGIQTVADLLFYLPSRYEDRTRITPIRQLQAKQTAQIVGVVEYAQIQFGRRRSLIATVTDDSGSMQIRLFHFNKAMQQRYQQGGRARVYGEPRFGKHGLEMVHPELQWLNPGSDVPVAEALTPVYPVTEGLSQLSVRKLIQLALSRLMASPLPDLLPENLLQRYQLPDLNRALQIVHAPRAQDSASQLLLGEHPAIVRLALEELVATQLSFAAARAKLRGLQAQPIAREITLTKVLLHNLSFSLTGAQQRVLQEIRQDLQRPQPMMRLLQGDVGAGKTLVAAFTAITAIGAGFQVALMAPTELLAEQHYRNFQRWFSPLNIEVNFLAGKIKGKAREKVLAQIAAGEAALVVGTHALFQEGVAFNNLALVIIDEQHRFGVHQRLQLFEKGREQQAVPHQLVMTATPIPRTLAMTAFADLDISVIDELPPGRKPISTVVIPDSRRDEVIERVRDSAGQGKQVYWVCTLIEESEVMEANAAESTAEYLQQQLQGLRVGIVHGRMKPTDKQTVMDAFKQHELDVLVATTVIEVGVDVPNASLMIIENAERLGLSQLHQLRGRVGRGAEQSYCVLLYHGQLSQQARERLAIMRESNDGFVIAEKDMALRGPGELLGTRQTGAVAFRIADIARDQRWVPVAQQLARELTEHYPAQAKSLMQRWMSDKARYSRV